MINSEHSNIKRQVMACYQISTEDPWLSVYSLKSRDQIGQKTSVTSSWCSEKSESISYKALVERASILAQQLKTLVPRDAFVLISMNPHLGIYISHLACLLADLTPVIFHPPNPKQSHSSFNVMCEQVLSSSKPHLVITDELSTPALSAAIAKSTGEKNDRVPRLICFEHLDFNRDFFCEDLLANQIESPPTDIAFLQYSSGTTGAKKGVIFRHRELLVHLERLSASLALSPQDHIASWLPLYHDMGFIACWLLPLLTMTRLSSISPYEWVREPSSLLEIITRESATLCWLPNFAFSLITDRVSNKREELKLNSLRQIISCSEFISYEVMSSFACQFFSRGLQVGALSTSYAMAENIFAVTHYPPGEPLQILTIDEEQLAQGRVALRYYGLPRTKTLISSGKALAGVALTILSEDALPLPDGYIGKIAYSSETIFGGYIVPKGEEALLAQDTRFGEQGEFYITKDLGFIYQGHLYVLGRTDDVMIIGGKNIYPYDIELILNTMDEFIPGRAVAVAVRTDGEETEGVVILAETRISDKEFISQLSLELRQRLTSTLDIPINNILFLPHMTLSKSTSGKLSRGKNKDRYLSGELIKLAFNQGDSLGVESDNTDDEITSLLKNTLSRTLNLAPSCLSLSTCLFSTGLLDSFNAHVFFDELASHLKKFMPDHDITQLKSIIVDLDNIGRIAEWCEIKRTSPEVLSSAKIDTEEVKPSLNQPYYQIFTLHGTFDDRLCWFRDAQLLSQYNQKTSLIGGGWIESPNVKTRTISTNHLGFRVTLFQGAELSEKKWSSSPQRALLLGDSAVFGIGVSDHEVVTSVLNDLNPERLWLNCAARGLRLASIPHLLQRLQHLPKSPVVLLGTGDLKDFSNTLSAIGSRVEDSVKGDLWIQFLERYQTNLMKIATQLGADLTLVHQPRVIYSLRNYQSNEADAFWRASTQLDPRVYNAYFSVHQDFEKYSNLFGLFLEDLTREIGVKFINYSKLDIFNVDEKLYYDTSHYTALMHSMIALRLNDDIRSFVHQ